MCTISPSRPSPSIYAIDAFVPSCAQSDKIATLEIEITRLENSVVMLREQNNQLINARSNSERRIAELEAQVRTLSALVLGK